MTDFTTLRTVMVDTQVRPSDVTKFPIIAAMLAVAREKYVPENLRETAYSDGDVDLGNGRVVLEPRTMGKLLDALDVRSDELVLDLGCGLGYSTALLAQLAEAVVGVEDDADRAADAQRTLSENGVDNAAIIEGTLTEGAAKHGPYDVIVVEGGVETLPPAIADQLKDGGRIACLFQQGALGEVRIGRKSDGQIFWRNAFNATAPILPGFEENEEFIL